MTYEIPIRTYSLANQREHWTKRARRAKAERKAAYLIVRKHSLPCTVFLVRQAPRMLDDDNLRGSFKSIRDGIADRLGVDDRNPLVKWNYDQVKAPTYGVSIGIVP